MGGYKILDKSLKVLRYYEQKPDSSFWDAHWESKINLNSIKAHEKYPLIIQAMKKKRINGRVLEAGCGMGGPLYCLTSEGYDAIGIDFAKETIHQIKKLIPSLELCISDVGIIPYRDSTFDAIWSIGVIEHFEKGYDIILQEMSRITRIGGFVFVSFPYMSPLRKLKTHLNLYPIQKADEDDIFYQYALNYNTVVQDFQNKGFVHLQSLPYDGIKGTKDEISILKPYLQKLYDYSGPNRKIYKIKSVVDRLLKVFGSHMMLLVFLRVNNE